MSLRAHITDEDFTAGRTALIARVEEIDPHREAALLLSGGVDSTTALFAMLASGRRPTCYTFRVGTYESPDVRSARRLAEAFELDHRVVSIERSEERLIADVETILELVDWSRLQRIKKTVIQCVHPFLYLCPELPPLTICGLGGDSFFLTRRAEAIALRELGDERVSAWRRSFRQDPDYADWHILDVAQRCFERTIVDFYDTTAWTRWIRQFTVKATHTPKEKWAAVGCFLDYWRRGAFYREHDPFQVGSGLRQYHDVLLQSRANTTGAKAVIGVYQELARRSGAAERLARALPLRDTEGRMIEADGWVVGEPR